MGRPVKDLSNLRFGRLVALDCHVRKTKHSTVAMWRCRCDCGGIVTARGSHLTRADVQSCGCLARESAALRMASQNHKHGLSHSVEYRSWTAMKARCLNVSHKHFPLYGGRGISICEDWKDSFEAFYRDMGPKPSSAHTLDRIDTDGDYCPSNCRWATQREQMNNVRRNRLVTYRSKRMTISEAARLAGVVHPNVANSRMRVGWTTRSAVETPAQPRRLKKDAVS